MSRLTFAVALLLASALLVAGATGGLITHGGKNPPPRFH
jgi:hypothetical protein